MKLCGIFLALLGLTCALAAETPAEAARQYTTAHQAKLTQEFSEFLSIPNVAADPANLKRNSDLLVETLRPELRSMIKCSWALFGSDMSMDPASIFSTSSTSPL